MINNGVILGNRRFYLFLDPNPLFLKIALLAIYKNPNDKNLINYLILIN